MARLLSTILVLAMLGCGATLNEPLTMAHPADDFVAVPFPPPPARPEFIPERPTATAVWIDGEWRWTRGRWSWVYGRWVEPPEGARYAPWTWHRDALGQLHYAPGGWRNEDGEAVAHPTPLKLANADEGDLLEDIGILEDVGPNLVAGVKRRWRGEGPAPCQELPDVDDTEVPDAGEKKEREEPRTPEDDCGAEAAISPD